MSYQVEIHKKTVVCRFRVTTAIENLQLCEYVENVLQSSTLGASPYGIEIEETKVVKSDLVEIKQT